MQWKGGWRGVSSAGGERREAEAEEERAHTGEVDQERSK